MSIIAAHPLVTIGLVSLLLSLMAIGLSLNAIMRRISTLQRQFFSYVSLGGNDYPPANIAMKNGRPALELKTTPSAGNKTEVTQRVAGRDSLYQSAIELFQRGHSIDQVIQSCQLSVGEAEFIHALHGK